MQNRPTLKAHTKIFKEGESAQKLYLIKHGKVVCLKLVNDRLIPVFMAGPGDVVGESAMLADSQYEYSAISFTDCDLVEIPSTSFSEVLKDSPDWLVDLTKTMVNRFQNTASLIAENRVIHPSVISEADFTPQLEVGLKKILI